MTRTPLSLPEIGLIAGTRAALGAGLALLLADRLNRDQRRGAGWTLFAIGAITTIPILVQLLGARREAREESERRAFGGRMAREEEYAS
jgi:hypothetical protein